MAATTEVGADGRGDGVYEAIGGRGRVGGHCTTVEWVKKAVAVVSVPTHSLSCLPSFMNMQEQEGKCLQHFYCNHNNALKIIETSLLHCALCGAALEITRKFQLVQNAAT